MSAPLDASGAGVDGLNGPNVTVKMPFNVEIDALNAELFGQEVTIEGTIINVTEPLTLANIYDSAAGEAWLHFLQAEDEDTFAVYVNQAKADEFAGDISGVLHIGDGTVYDPTNNGVDHLDASGVWADNPSVTDPWLKYASLQDFLMGYFAAKILGHPGALAVISNDSSLRSSFTNKYTNGMLAVRGATGACFASLPTQVDVSGVADAVGSASGETNGLTAADLNVIVQQIMDAAPDRFTNGDRGVLLPVQWKSQDKIQIQLHCKDNTYQLKNPASTSSQGVLSVTAQTAANGASLPTGAQVALTNDKYVLQFTIA